MHAFVLLLALGFVLFFSPPPAALLLLQVSAQTTPNCLALTPAPIPAENVLGQPNFNSSAANPFSQPIPLAFSPTSGKLFVASNAGANNVARFNSTAFFANGVPPEFVIGSGGACDGNAHFNGPRAIFVDASDSLYVADSNNNRVLVFPSASSIAVPNPAATQVFGQPNFTSCMSVGAGLNQLSFPQGVFVDNARDILWISDAIFTRVLRFDSLSTQPSTNAFANVQFGTTGTGNCSQTQFGQPAGLAVDSLGNLWVDDFNLARVLRFNSAHTKPSGAPADLVIGQPNFIICNSGTTQSLLSSPFSVALDPTGTLYVSDVNNNRVMGFLNAISLATNGPLADFQIGQPNFTSATSSPPVSQTSFNQPAGIVFDNQTTNSLFVASFGENRVLRYCSAISTSNSVSPSNSNSGSTSGSNSNSNSVSSTATPPPSTSGSATASLSGSSTSSSSTSVTASASTSAPVSNSVSGSSSGGASSSGSLSTGSSPSGSQSLGVTGSQSSVPTASTSFGASATHTSSTGVSGSGSSTAQSVTQSLGPGTSTTQSLPVCGDGIVELLEQCDPPSKAACCNNVCQFNRVRAVCGKRPDRCHFPRRCGLANAKVPSSGVVCKPARKKRVGAICRRFPRVRRCTAQGKCV